MMSICVTTTVMKLVVQVSTRVDMLATNPTASTYLALVVFASVSCT
jgi:hypothetical protein